jgi:N-carbamoyl-L-amino-acid hydrolase
MPDNRSHVSGVTEADIDAARDRSSGETMRDALSDVGSASSPPSSVSGNTKQHHLRG